MFNRRAIQLLIDAGVLGIAFILAYFIRFDGFPPPNYRSYALLQFPYVLLLEIMVLSLAGLQKTSWRYVSLSDVPRIGIGLGIATAILVGFRLGLPSKWALFRVPFGVLAANGVLAAVGLLAVRIVRRVQTEWMERKALIKPRPRKAKKVVLIGAGRAGALVAREIANRPDLGLRVVGFVDDDPEKIGTHIQGARVLGDTRSLREIVEEHEADQAIISIANAPGETIRAILQACEAVPIHAKIIPGVYEILDGRVNLTRVRDVQIEDLLGREPVELDTDSISSVVEGRRVLVTGAGGSIGSELCRQISRYTPQQLVLLEQAETPLFFVERELKRHWPTLDTVPVIADICDAERVRDVFQRYRPEVVFHAAAHKHVPMMEANPGEAIKNNIFGTKQIADACDTHRCPVMVLISTDKAVNPTSVMGASKRVAELYVQALNRRSQTNFVAVRFGNVLGSAGSVIPIFKQQIAAGGPVTVTHPDMTRYFMTIPEASQLVIQAAAISEGGEIFVLDMGKPVKIVSLARDMIRLSGLREGEDIRIEFSGPRPGEKMFEELALDGEGISKTRHPKIFIGKLEPFGWERIEQALTELDALREVQELGPARRAFADVLPEFQDDHRVATAAPEPAEAPLQLVPDGSPSPV